MKHKYIIGSIQAGETAVNNVSTKLGLSDYLGAVIVRWGINRNNYKVNPGLYSVGSPDNTSDVFVTANYKLSFDHLRKNLNGIDGWILVLDTKGVNVWCAAGKGTFGTDELNDRIKRVSLDKVVSHRRIILPQLGATGVAAHRIKDGSGFNVKYGPVRAADIKEFLNSGYQATGEMRKVNFRFWDRIKLIPNDFMYGKFYLIGALFVIFLLSSFHIGQFSPVTSMNRGLTRMFNVFAAYFSGIVITPALLPYIPVRRFYLKGFITGALTVIILFLLNKTGSDIFEKISWFFIIPAVSSFMAMNFTGSSTFTSLSGVKKEMKTAVPFQILFLSVGLILFITGLFI
ncbi:MAG: mercury methylation corrinoid protein HgcA [Bacteroidota bacterium]|nr:mercury methylation corrinoid protein HgcA [Bacteroidota bacterium]